MFRQTYKVRCWPTRIGGQPNKDESNARQHASLREPPPPPKKKKNKKKNVKSTGEGTGGGWEQKYPFNSKVPKL